MNRFLPAVLAAASLAATACATNPVTGDRQLALISESQEIEMGRQTAASAESQMGLVDDPALQDYVQRLGMSMATPSERPELPWQFRVIDDATPNAFAAPGGFIYITRGMLSLMNNEAELASVLGHEIGHVTARHSVAMLSRQQLAQLGLGLGSVLSPTVAELGELASAGLSVLFMSYGRDAERQADDLGFRYALDQGYDMTQMPHVFASLARVGEAAGRSPIPAWMSTHPYPEERIERIEGRLAESPSPLGARREAEEYLARIDGLTYGDDPRHGYFDGARFLHPEMRFQLAFPSGWETRNMAQAVMAGSPQQDAVIQLTLAEGSPQEAAAAFFGQPGLVAGATDDGAVNGLPASSGAFQAETEQGVVGGIARFIALDEFTVQLLAYAPAERVDAHAAAFTATLDSFARLTDPAALAMEPQRIAVVAVPEAITLQEFDAAHPSVIPIEELALINQLADGAAVIPAGTRVKRVVD